MATRNRPKNAPLRQLIRLAKVEELTGLCRSTIHVSHVRTRNRGHGDGSPRKTDPVIGPIVLVLRGVLRSGSEFSGH